MRIRSLIAACGVCLLPATLWAQYVPPIGIPVPPFGIDQVTPAATTPVTSLPATVTAGQVVTLTGTISNGGSINCSGTATNPAWILGTPTLQMSGEFNISGSYCIVDGITLVGYHQFGIDGNHNVLRNSDSSGILTEATTAAIIMGGQYNVVYHNTVHNHGNVNAPDDQDAHGISVTRGASIAWILNNEAWANSGDGINCNPYPYDDTMFKAIEYVFIGGNKSHDNKQTGVWCKASENIIVSTNEVYGHHGGNSSFGQGIGFQYSTNGWWALNNNIHDNDVCIGVAEGSNPPNPTGAAIIGNLCAHAHGLSCSPDPTDPLWSCAGFYLTGDGYSYVLNNTLTDVIDGIHAQRGAGLAVAGTVGNTNVNSSEPTVPMADLATAFRNAYALDISSLTGGTPPPPPPPPNQVAPLFTAAMPPLTAKVGTGYSYQFQASGVPAAGFMLLNAPTWLTNNAGLVTGVPPTGTTSFSYGIAAQNGVTPDAFAGPFTVAVAPAGLPKCSTLSTNLFIEYLLFLARRCNF